MQSDAGGQGNRAELSAAAVFVESHLSRVIPRGMLIGLAAAVRLADTGIDRYDLAEQCGIPRRTLHRRLWRAGLKSPTHVIAWGRILAACWFLDRDLTLEQVALSLELNGSSALVHLFRGHAETTPGVVRDAGGLLNALDILRRQIASNRNTPMSETADV